MAPGIPGFPSVSQELLHGTLSKFDVPDDWQLAIPRLYKHNQHYLQLHHQRYPSIVPSNGVRQGCPLSPVLVALLSDVLLQRLQREFPEAVIRAFADDTALVLPEPTEAKLTHLRNILQDWARASNMEVNDKKTVFIPICLDVQSLDQRLSANVVHP